MKRDTRTSEQHRTEARYMFAIIPGLTGIGGAIAGAIIAATAGGTLKAWIGIDVAWWHGLLIGGVCGFIAGIFQARAMMQRTEEYSESAELLGLERLSDEDTEKVSRSIHEMMPGRDARMWDCHFSKNENVSVVLGDMGIESSDYSSNSNEEVQQTCVYLEFSDFVFPEFRLQAEGFSRKILKAIVGGTDIDFADSPVFSKKYVLAGNPEDAVRKLFNIDVRLMFEQNPGLTIVAKKNQMAIYQAGKTCSVSGLGQFLSTCLMIANELQNSGVAITPQSLVEPPANIESALAEADATGGILGALYRREIERKGIETDEVSNFLSQSVPRTVPRQLKNSVATDKFLELMLLAFSIAGLAIGGFTIVLGEDVQTKLIGSLVGILMLGLFGTILWLVKSFEWRQLKLLSQGDVRCAIIENVAESAFVNGNERVFNVQFRFVDGDNAEATTRIQGYPAKAAKKYQESGEQVRVLHHLAHPDKYLLVDCFALK